MAVLRRKESSDITLESVPCRCVRGRWATVTKFQHERENDIRYIEGDMFDEVKLSHDDTSKTLELNSVLLFPNLLTETECILLFNDVECCHNKFLQRSLKAEQLAETPAGPFPSHVRVGRARWKICDLSKVTQQIFSEMLYSRFLPFIATQPHLERFVWEQSLPACEPSSTKKLPELSFYFAENEPAINRYTTCGIFEPHVDSHAITVNILLSDKFTGGGTQFWRETGDQALSDDGSIGEPTCIIHPKVGCGMIWNGNVMHSGAETVSGTRYLLVASLTISAKHGFS